MLEASDTNGSEGTRANVTTSLERTTDPAPHPAQSPRDLNRNAPRAHGSTTSRFGKDVILIRDAGFGSRRDLSHPTCANSASDLQLFGWIGRCHDANRLPIRNQALDDMGSPTAAGMSSKADNTLRESAKHVPWRRSHPAEPLVGARFLKFAHRPCPQHPNSSRRRNGTADRVPGRLRPRRRRRRVSSRIGRHAPVRLSDPAYTPSPIGCGCEGVSRNAPRIDFGL